MLWTVVNECDIFYDFTACPAGNNSVRSSNPFNYIRNGYYLDNASLFGGKNNVDFNSNISGAGSGSDLDIPHI